MIRQRHIYFFRIIQIGLLTLICNFSIGQQLTYDFQYFSKESGLTDHRVLSILEHSDGFVWVGTYNGLNRFDGYEFMEIPLPDRKESTNGTLDPYIDELYELDDGKIIVIYGDGGGSYNQIAIIYDPLTNKSKEIVLEDFNQPTPTLKVKNGQPLKIKLLTTEWNSTQSKVSDHFGNYILQEAENGKRRTLLVLKSGEILDITETRNTLFNSQVFGNDFSKIIFFSSLNGMVKLDIHRSPFKTYLNADLEDWGYNLSGRAIGTINNGKVLFSTEQQELALLDNSTKEVKTVSLINHPQQKKTFPKGSKDIRSIYSENDSIVWLTYYYSYGLMKLNVNTGEAISYLGEDNALHNKFISSIRTQDDKILILTYNRAKTIQLIEFDLKSLQKKYYTSISKILSKVEARSTAILQTKNQNIWIGTTLGLFQLDLTNEKLLNAYYSENLLGRDTSEAYSKHYILPANSILSLYENEDNELLIGTDGGGVIILNLLTGAFEVLDKSKGMSDNIVCSILPDPKGYWFGTYNGLAFFDKEQKSFRNFFKKNGLGHNEFNRFSAAQDTDGINYFGGMNGFISFDPREVLEQKNPTEILFCNAVYFDQGESEQINEFVGLDEYTKINIPSSNRSCSFLMSMTDFKNADNHQYDYKLESKSSLFSNSEAFWQSNGRNRKIQFDYLPAGNYDLHIRGTSAEGILTNEFIIQLSVQEFFYKTWWFITACILGVSGVLYLFYRNRLNRAIEMEKLRTRLSSDLHDDVGSVLSGVAYQMELLEFTVPEENKSLVQQIAASSRRAMSQMRDVVWAMDTRKGSMQDLVDRMSEFAKELLEPLEIEYKIQTDELPLGKEIAAEVRHSVLLIFKEFLTNTVKHAEASKVSVHLFRNGKNLEMKIQDNGKGLPDDVEMSTGQGLENMKMRARKIKGQLDFLNENGFGIHLKAMVF